MPTTKVSSASPVAETPSIQAILEKTQQVNSLREQLMQNIRSADREFYRNIWAQARAELSQMQILYHFSGKEVCHA